MTTDPHLVLVGDLRSSGRSRRELDRDRRAGDLVTVRRGVVSEHDLPDDARAAHRVLLRAVRMVTGPTWVLSHHSACILWDLPVDARGLDRVWLTRPPGPGGHRRPGIMTRSCRVGRDEMELVDGFAVTSLARTAVDMAMECGFATGLMVADAVLGRGVERRAMSDVVDRARRRHGIGHARAVLAAADARAESPGESLLRAMLIAGGIDVPELQYEIRDESGRFIARVDMAWPGLGVVGEYDGKVKYGSLLRPGQRLDDVVMAEKVRENALRALGWQVMRFSADDLAHRDRTLRMVTKVLDWAQRERGDGWTPLAS